MVFVSVTGPIRVGDHSSKKFKMTLKQFLYSIFTKLGIHVGVVKLKKKFQDELCENIPKGQKRKIQKSIGRIVKTPKLKIPNGRKSRISKITNERNGKNPKPQMGK